MDKENFQFMVFSVQIFFFSNWNILCWMKNDRWNIFDKWFSQLLMLLNFIEMHSLVDFSEEIYAVYIISVILCAFSIRT